MEEKLENAKKKGAKVFGYILCIFIGCLFGNTIQSITNHSKMQEYRNQKTVECKVIKKDNELEIPTTSTKN
jgi:hypothetical protein